MKLSKKKLEQICIFFCIGFVINGIPHILNILENKNNAKLELLEKNFLKKQQEKACKEKIEYSKFFEMGFEETAKKRLISCMKN